MNGVRRSGKPRFWFVGRPAAGPLEISTLLVQYGYWQMKRLLSPQERARPKGRAQPVANAMTPLCAYDRRAGGDQLEDEGSCSAIAEATRSWLIGGRERSDRDCRPISDSQAFPYDDLIQRQPIHLDQGSSTALTSYLLCARPCASGQPKIGMAQSSFSCRTASARPSHGSVAR